MQKKRVESMEKKERKKNNAAAAATASVNCVAKFHLFIVSLSRPTYTSRMFIKKKATKIMVIMYMVTLTHQPTHAYIQCTDCRRKSVNR